MMSNCARDRYFDPERTDLRFSVPQENRTFRIATLWDSHREICRRLALGEKATDIAASLGISKAMVSYTKNSKVAQDQISILRGAMDADTIDLGQKIQKFAPVALQLLEHIIAGQGDGKEASIRLRANTAERYMDRAGYAPVKKIATMSTTLTREDIDIIKTRARRSALEAGIIEAEIVNG